KDLSLHLNRLNFVGHRSVASWLLAERASFDLSVGQGLLSFKLLLLSAELREAKTSALERTVGEGYHIRVLINLITHAAVDFAGEVILENVSIKFGERDVHLLTFRKENVERFDHTVISVE